MTAATDIRWRVQTRLSRTHKWRNAGLFETRSVARAAAAEDRETFGFQNTRVIPHRKA